jgi:hypothetical protein
VILCTYQVQQCTAKKAKNAKKEGTGFDMSATQNDNLPPSPEEQPAEVRAELEQQNVTHRGKRARPARNKADAESYMGATEDNVTPVQPPMVGASEVTKPGEDETDVNPRTELTPG